MNPHSNLDLVVSKVNKWIISETVQMVRNIETAIASYRFNDAANLIYQFTWATFCDWYLEFTKPLLANSENVLLKETRKPLVGFLKQIFNSLNPLMPTYRRVVGAVRIWWTAY